MEAMGKRFLGLFRKPFHHQTVSVGAVGILFAPDMVLPDVAGLDSVVLGPQLVESWHDGLIPRRLACHYILQLLLIYNSA